MTHAEEHIDVTALGIDPRSTPNRPSMGRFALDPDPPEIDARAVSQFVRVSAQTVGGRVKATHAATAPSVQVQDRELAMLAS